LLPNAAILAAGLWNAWGEWRFERDLEEKLSRLPQEVRAALRAEFGDPEQDLWLKFYCDLKIRQLQRDDRSDSGSANRDQGH
jgi:hypothetical protein